MSHTSSWRRRRNLVLLLLGVLGSSLVADAAPVHRIEPKEPPRPANDDLINAVPIHGASGGIDGGNVGATSGAPAGLIAGDDNTLGHSVWYRWVAPKSGGYTFRTNSDFDCMIEAWQAIVPDYASVNNAVSINGSLLHSPLPDPAHPEDLPFWGYEQMMPYITRPQPYQFSMTINALEDRTYFIAVQDLNGQEGRFALSWKGGPDNDNFADASLISGATGKTPGDNSGASHEEREPTIGDAKAPFLRQGINPCPSPSVWYRWTAPKDGDFTFHVKDDFASTVGVMTEDTPGKLTVDARAPDPVFPDDRLRHAARCRRNRISRGR